MICQRCCNGLLFYRIVITDQGRAEFLSCLKCGWVLDPVILSNRQPENAAKWRKETNRELKELSRTEKILQEYTEEAILADR